MGSRRTSRFCTRKALERGLFAKRAERFGNASEAFVGEAFKAAAEDYLAELERCLLLERALPFGQRFAFGFELAERLHGAVLSGHYLSFIPLAGGSPVLRPAMPKGV